MFKQNLKYKMFRGLRDYSTSDYYWNQIPRERMTQLLDLTVKKGYEKALVEIYQDLKNDKTISASTKKLLTPSHFKTYILDESRAKFIDLLDLPKGARVLDLGCGWGAITIALARKLQKTGGEIVGVDGTKETLAFINERAKQEGIKNIQLIAADPFEFGNLPFEDAKFDLVIMNGVLEWVGLGRLEISPRECQEIALREVKRVLKNGGQYYVGIENAAAYDYYLGQSDHSGIRFVGAFPHWLADVVSRLVKREPYRTYIYNYEGYKKLFAKMGFGSVKFFLPMPSYRNIAEIVSFTDKAARNAYKKYVLSGSKGSKFKRQLISLLMKLPGSRKHVYSYSMVIQK